MASRFWVGGTGTWDAANTAFWSATTGGAGGASVPVAGDSATFDASSGGGTVTVNHATLNLTSLTIGAFTGTLDFSANDNNITITNSVSITGTGTRTLNMGDGTWTLSATGGASAWDATTTTNLTFNANGSTIAFTGNGAISVILNTLTYNVLQFGAVTNGQIATLSGAATVASMTMTAPRNLRFTGGTTLTLSAAPTWTGSISSPILLESSSVITAATITCSAGAPAITGAMIRGITFGGSLGTATSSVDLGGNTNITITNPASSSARVIGG